MPIWMTVVHRPTRVPGKAARASVDLKDNPDLIYYLSCNNVLLDRAVSAMRPSRKHIERRQAEEEEFVQEGMEIEQPGDSGASSTAQQQSDVETGSVQDFDDDRDCILLDESDMGSVNRDPDHWSQRLEEVLQQHHQVERSEEAGLRVTITRAKPTALSPPPPQPPPSPLQPTPLLPPPVAAPDPTPIKVPPKPTVASKVVKPASTQPSTSQEKTGSDKRKQKTAPKKRRSQQESMEVDGGDQARAQVSKGTPLDQLKDWPVHTILARIPTRPMQPSERTNG